VIVIHQTGSGRFRTRELPREQVPADDASPAPCRAFSLLATVVLAGYLLFAHGCHGDEDTELFIRWLHSRAVPKASP
jgi:hypothetical protein